MQADRVHMYLIFFKKYKVMNYFYDLYRLDEQRILKMS